jgi:FkbM family methyltransferase
LKYKNPAYIQALNDDLAFYQTALEEPLALVFDIGANHGDKTWAFRQMAKKVVCVEPDATCFAALRSRYGRDRGVRLENVALGGEVGVGTFFVEEEGSAYNTLNEKERDWIVSEYNQHIREVSVPVSTLDSMIEKYGTPDFLKVDVEGGELQVFKGLSKQIPVICFEANLPRFREETCSIIDRYSEDTVARFNLRLENDFVFSTHRPAGEIVDLVKRNDEVSYDVFIYNE